MSTGASGSWSLRLHGAFDWVLWVMIVNVLWYVFVLAGALVLGVAPATIAAAELTRRKLRGEAFPVVRTFAAAWRREFWRANAVLAPVGVVQAILVFNAIGLAQAGELDAIPGIATLAALLVAFLLGAVAAPLYVHYDLPLRAYLITTSRWMMRNLPHVLLIVLAATLVTVASLLLPGLIPFVSLGAWLTISTALCVAFFTANERHLAEGSTAPSRPRAGIRTASPSVSSRHIQIPH